MDHAKRNGRVAVATVLVTLMLAYTTCYLAWLLAWGAVLRVWVWYAHAACGRRVLFVYSESPNWKPYIEEKILPRLVDRAVVLNWSRPRLWPSTSPWEGRFFRRFRADREFNPLALVFCRWGRIRPVRFHRAFLESKRGRQSPLRAAQRKLFALIETAGA